MEIIGTFKVRNGDENLIRSPPNVYGEFELTLHDDGSFSYRPVNGQTIIPATRYVVKDPKNIIDPISFKDEKKAIEWKEKMERVNKRVFRMEKIFNSRGIKPLGEQINEWYQIL